MRDTESNCVGCETCRCCGRNIEKAFFYCDRCEIMVSPDVEIGSSDDDEAVWLKEAPDESGQMWCDDCIEKWKEEEAEREREEELSRFDCSAFSGMDLLNREVKDLEVSTFLDSGKWYTRVAGTFGDGFDLLFGTESYSDYREMLEELNKLAGAWNKLVREKVTK